MRLRQYLLQERDVLDLSNEISDFNDQIQQDCKEYLQLIKGKDPLFRGMKTEDEYGKKKIRKNRKSRIMPSDLFEKFNKWLEENGHNRRDRSIPVISDPSNAEIFGLAYYIFPIGKMSYSWIRANDINIDYSRTGWGGFGAIRLYFEDNKDTTEGFKSYFFTDRGFDEAYKNNYEIWINCKEYYFISANMLKGLAKWDQNKQRFVM